MFFSDFRKILRASKSVKNSWNCSFSKSFACKTDGYFYVEMIGKWVTFVVITFCVLDNVKIVVCKLFLWIQWKLKCNFVHQIQKWMSQVCPNVLISYIVHFIIWFCSCVLNSLFKITFDVWHCRVFRSPIAWCILYVNGINYPSIGMNFAYIVQVWFIFYNKA